jgi:transketolase
MMRLGDHCGQHLGKMAETDGRIWVVDGDLADSDGAIHFSETHPERFVMAGIAEQSMVSMAAGMATCGLRPWVFSFASFLVFRAYDQIRVCMSQSRQPVTLVGSHSGGLTNRNGKSHAALNDIALMATLPHMRIWSPADPQDLFFAMKEIVADNEPAYLRLPRRPLPPIEGCPGLIRVLHPAKEITIISTGLATHLAIEAAALLKEKGIVVGLIHCLRISPLPEKEIKEKLDTAKKVVVIEDHVTQGGLASMIAAWGMEIPVMALGWPMGWTGQSGSDESILELCSLDPVSICQRIMQES